jgi:hypothetical protein
VGADEEHGRILEDRRRKQGGQAARAQHHVAAATVAGRFAALDQARVVEDPEVVGEQVRRRADELAELARRAVAEREGLDDLQAVGIGERGVHPGPGGEVHAQEHKAQ